MSQLVSWSSSGSLQEPWTPSSPHIVQQTLCIVGQVREVETRPFRHPCLNGRRGEGKGGVGRGGKGRGETEPEAIHQSGEYLEKFKFYF